MNPVQQIHKIIKHGSFFDFAMWLRAGVSSGGSLVILLSHPEAPCTLESLARRGNAGIDTPEDLDNKEDPKRGI